MNFDLSRIIDEMGHFTPSSLKRIKYYDFLLLCNVYRYVEDGKRQRDSYEPYLG